MKKAFTKSMMAVALAAGSLVALPACTDGEIIASSIIIGAAVIADDDHDHHHHHHHGRIVRPQPHYPSNPVRPGHHRVSPPRRVYALEQGQRLAIDEQAPAPEFVSSDERVIKTADKYEISHYAATYVVRAILLAQSKDLSGMKDIGLEKSDLKKIYQGKALDDDKLQVMAAKLLMSEEDTAILIDDMSQDIQAEKAARE